MAVIARLLGSPNAVHFGRVDDSKTRLFAAEWEGMESTE
jgi:hypothetical protein